MEAAAAGFEVCVPVSGGVTGLCGNGKAVEAVLALTHVLGVELSFRGVHLKRGRMAFREGLVFIGKNSRYVEGVSGAPYAAFSVNETFEAFGEGFSSYVEAAQ